MKKEYSIPIIDFISFVENSEITTSAFSFDELDDGFLYGDKW